MILLSSLIDSPNAISACFINHHLSINTIASIVPPLPALSFLNQTFVSEDLVTVAVLVILEGILSIDNAIVLGLLALRVRPELRSRALSYGLIGALVMRFLAIALATYLLHWRIVKLAGGAYLIWITIKHFLLARKKSGAKPTLAPSPKRFWLAVLSIELMDLAFAADSILAAVALVGSPPPGTPPNSLHPKFWVIVTGGMFGVILMRFAAAAFSKLLIRFPNLSISAYIMVAIIGIKLILDWGFNDENHERLDFQSPGKLEFWAFWGSMAACLAIGLIPGTKAKSLTKPSA